MPTPVEVSRDWRREPRRGPRRVRRLKFGLAWVSLFTFTALLMWVSTWLSPPRPTRLVLLGAGYQDNLAAPHNVYGWQSLADLAELTRADGLFSFWGARLLRLPHGPLQVWSNTAWDQALADVPQRSVVLYFTLHGATDEAGPFLFTADVDGAGEPKHRLRLTAVLDRLAKLPPQKQKVLLLDCTQMMANWRLGVLANNFAAQLKQIEPQISAVPNLVVLCASDEGQRSWVCDEWRQTVYSHYIIEGLKGAAADLENDGRINAWELHRFARASVGDWVQANRAAAQTPILLPSGEEGRRRASQIDLAVARRDYQPPSPHGVPEFQLPADLAPAWERHYQLSRQSPPPAAYAPQTWRIYQDTLLRYEQLVLAGDREWAVRLERQIQELATRIERSRTLDLASLSNTLTMPAAAGYQTPWQPEEVELAASELWNAPAVEAAPKWLALQARLAHDDISRQLLRLKLCDWLLERAAEDPETHLAGATRLLNVIGDPLRPRPAEAHYAVMLRRDMPEGNVTSEHSELLRAGLSVRRLAEQAALAVHEQGHPYSEFFWDILAPQIERADVNRRAGEDLLLASPHQWAQARQQLEAARTGYLAALDSGRQIQTALQTRDDVLCMLPYYTRCIAHWLENPANVTVADELRSGGKAATSATERDDELVRLLIQLWQQTHELCTRLDDLVPEQAIRSTAGVAAAEAVHENPSADPQWRNLAEQAALVHRSYEDARGRLCAWWQELSSAEVPSVWHEADAALLVPHRDPQLRMKLIVNKRRTSRRLFIETAQQSWRRTKSQRDQIAGNETAAARTSPPAAARQQGELALSVLGPRWFDACNVSPKETFEQVQHRLDVYQVEEQWQASLARAGDQIAQRWRLLPVAINKLVASAGGAPRTEALQLLERAERLTRLADGPEAQALAGDPVTACRRLRMQDLLLWQARRTLADHWYSEDPQAAPYFRLAGSIWLGDAQQLDAHVKAVAAMRQKYTEAKPLSLAGCERLQFTTQLRQEVTYRLDGGCASAAGFPVVWVVPAAELDIEAPTPGQRQVRQVGASSAASLITCTLGRRNLQKADTSLPQAAAMEATSLSVRGLFRGQQLAITTPVELYAAAETTAAVLPLPQRGSLAVRADARLQEQFGQAHGTIVVVLDCSGSMGPPNGESFGKATKFAEATAALRQVLARLPRGATVSVWAFGQAVGAQKTADPPESSIRRVQDPIRWNGQDAAQLEQVMARLEYPALEPWNESPIVRAMLAAKADLTSAGGFRTLLVLTDGMDNRFEKSAMTSQKADIGAALRTAFDGSGIAVNVIGFKVAQTEAAHAQRQFAIVESFDPPGKFITVDQAESLANALDAALRQQLHYKVENYDRTPLADSPPDGLDVSSSRAGDRWFPGGLKPGSYRLRIAGEQRTAEATIHQGDLLLLRLSESAGQLGLSRLNWSREDFPWKPHVENARWRLSLMQNQRTAEGALRMLVSLEQLAGDGDGALEQLRPREAWLELTTREPNARTIISRWRPVTGYPAAVWSADAPAWPMAAEGVTPARPRVRLWFNAEQEAPAAATLRRHHDFMALSDLAGRAVRVSGDEVTIEAVGVERHLVETRPGVRQPQSCLVVRISHPTDKRVWARVRGLHLAGQEHRYYSAIGSYSGLFWPVTSDEAELALANISLISLNDFQQAAQLRGGLLELSDLPPPAPDDLPPRAPLELP